MAVADWLRVFASGLNCDLAVASVLFLCIADYYFFEEFRSRFSTVAIDYLLYPHEVFVNVWSCWD